MRALLLIWITREGKGRRKGGKIGRGRVSTQVVDCGAGKSLYWICPGNVYRLSYGYAKSHRREKERERQRRVRKSGKKNANKP